MHDRYAQPLTTRKSLKSSNVITRIPPVASRTSPGLAPNSTARPGIQNGISHDDDPSAFCVDDGSYSLPLRSRHYRPSYAQTVHYRGGTDSSDPAVSAERSSSSSDSGFIDKVTAHGSPPQLITTKKPRDFLSCSNSFWSNRDKISKGQIADSTDTTMAHIHSRTNTEANQRASSDARHHRQRSRVSRSVSMAPMDASHVQLQDKLPIKKESEAEPGCNPSQMATSSVPNPYSDQLPAVVIQREMSSYIHDTPSSSNTTEYGEHSTSRVSEETQQHRNMQATSCVSPFVGHSFVKTESAYKSVDHMVSNSTDLGVVPTASLPTGKRARRHDDFAKRLTTSNKIKMNGSPTSAGGPAIAYKTTDLVSANNAQELNHFSSDKENRSSPHYRAKNGVTWDLSSRNSCQSLLSTNGIPHSGGSDCSNNPGRYIHGHHTLSIQDSGGDSEDSPSPPHVSRPSYAAANFRESCPVASSSSNDGKSGASSSCDTSRQPASRYHKRPPYCAYVPTDSDYGTSNQSVDAIEQHSQNEHPEIHPCTTDFRNPMLVQLPRGGTCPISKDTESVFESQAPELDVNASSTKALPITSSRARKSGHAGGRHDQIGERSVQGLLPPSSGAELPSSLLTGQHQAHSSGYLDRVGLPLAHDPENHTTFPTTSQYRKGDSQTTDTPSFPRSLTPLHKPVTHFALTHTPNRLREYEPGSGFPARPFHRVHAELPPETADKAIRHARSVSGLQSVEPARFVEAPSHIVEGRDGKVPVVAVQVTRAGRGLPPRCPVPPAASLQGVASDPVYCLALAIQNSTKVLQSPAVNATPKKLTHSSDSDTAGLRFTPCPDPATAATKKRSAGTTATMPYGTISLATLSCKGSSWDSDGNRVQPLRIPPFPEHEPASPSNAPDSRFYGQQLSYGSILEAMSGPPSSDAGSQKSCSVEKTEYWDCKANVIPSSSLEMQDNHRNRGINVAVDAKDDTQPAKWHLSPADVLLLTAQPPSRVAAVAAGYAGSGLLMPNLISNAQHWLRASGFNGPHLAPPSRTPPSAVTECNFVASHFSPANQCSSSVSPLGVESGIETFYPSPYYPVSLEDGATAIPDFHEAIAQDREGTVTGSGQTSGDVSHFNGASLPTPCPSIHVRHEPLPSDLLIDAPYTPYAEQRRCQCVTEQGDMPTTLIQQPASQVSASPSGSLQPNSTETGRWAPLQFRDSIRDAESRLTPIHKRVTTTKPQDYRSPAGPLCDFLPHRRSLPICHRSVCSPVVPKVVTEADAAVTPSVAATTVPMVVRKAQSRGADGAPLRHNQPVAFKVETTTHQLLSNPRGSEKRSISLQDSLNEMAAIAKARRTTATFGE